LFITDTLIEIKENEIVRNTITGRGKDES